MAHLPQHRINALADAFGVRLMYDALTRSAMFAGVDRTFVAMQPIAPMPAIQLALDLDTLNRTERLVNGTVPLEIWLQNGARFLRPYPEVTVFERALGDLVIRGGGPPIQNPTARLPVIQEKSVDRDDMVQMSFLDGGARAGASVVRLVIQRYDNEVATTLPDGTPARYHGSGWLLAPDLLMTNHHVVNARGDGEPDASSADFALQAQHALAEFGFDSDSMVPRVTPLAGLEAADSALDFAVLRLAARAVPAPLRLLPDRVAAPGAEPPAVNIIQHPFGRAKKVALRNNYVYDAEYPKLRYFTDTERGSSGSPVFDDQWRVVGLHRATTYVEGVQFQGRPTGWVNEGVQLAAIAEHLRTTTPALWKELGLV